MTTCLRFISNKFPAGDVFVDDVSHFVGLNLRALNLVTSYHGARVGLKMRIGIGHQILRPSDDSVFFCLSLSKDREAVTKLQL